MVDILGMKIKLSKYGDPSIIQSEDHKKDDIPKRTESPIGVKIKLSKTGDASIVEDIIVSAIKKAIKILMFNFFVILYIILMKHFIL